MQEEKGGGSIKQFNMALKKNTHRALSVLESAIDVESPIPGKESQSPDTWKP